MPENTKNQLYEFGGFRLDPLRRVLFGADGAAIRLKPKVLDTLLCLVERGGAVLSKAELMRAVWGDLVVEENSLNKHISTLRHVFGETPGENRYIVTVPGKGYRFVATVRTATGVESESPGARAGSVEAARETPGSPPLRWLNRWYVLAGVAGAALLLVITWSIRSPITPTSIQSIAVLPFDNLSAGDEEYFSDGLTIELMELLTKIPGLRVIGRESAFWFKGKDTSYAEIGENLNVSHLLEGTVRVAGDQVRVTASLIDPGTSAQVWSDSFGPRPMTDIFAIQTEIASEVVEELRIALTGDLPALDQPNSPEVHSLYLRARHILRTDPKRLGYARELLEQAVEDDPNFFPARYWLAGAYYYLSVFPGPDRAENGRLWVSTVEQAALRWPDRPEILLFRAMQARDNQDHATAAQYLERSLRQDPGPSEPWAFAQNLLYELNRPEDAVEIGERVLTRDPICGPCYQALARNYVLLRRFEDAVAVYAQAQDLGLEMPFDTMHAAALLFSGDHAAALAEYRRDEVPPAVRLAGSAMALYALGRIAEYEQALAELNDLVQTQPDWRGMLALVHAFVGNTDQAFAILNGLPRLRPEALSDPLLDSLREHSRYEELLEKAGIWPDDPRESIRFQFSLPE